VKGAKVPLHEGEINSPYRNVFIMRKYYIIDAQPRKGEAFPLEHRGDARLWKRPCDGGILAKYSAGKHIDEPGKQARKGGVVHSE